MNLHVALACDGDLARLSASLTALAMVLRPGDGLVVVESGPELQAGATIAALDFAPGVAVQALALGAYPPPGPAMAAALGLIQAPTGDLALMLRAGDLPHEQGLADARAALARTGAGLALAPADLQADAQAGPDLLRPRALGQYLFRLRPEWLAPLRGRPEPEALVEFHWQLCLAHPDALPLALPLTVTDSPAPAGPAPDPGRLFPRLLALDPPGDLAALWLLGQIGAQMADGRIGNRWLWAQAMHDLLKGLPDAAYAAALARSDSRGGPLIARLRAGDLAGALAFWGQCDLQDHLRRLETRLDGLADQTRAQAHDLTQIRHEVTALGLIAEHAALPQPAAEEKGA